MKDEKREDTVYAVERIPKSCVLTLQTLLFSSFFAAVWLRDTSDVPLGINLWNQHLITKIYNVPQITFHGHLLTGLSISFSFLLLSSDWIRNRNEDVHHPIVRKSSTQIMVELGLSLNVLSFNPA